MTRTLPLALAALLIAACGGDDRPPAPDGPPVENAIEAFRTAWNGDDVAGVAALFRPMSRDKFARWLTGYKQKNDWERLPPVGVIRDRQELPGTIHQVALWFKLPSLGGAHELFVRFKLIGEKWWLDKVRPITP